MRAKIEPTAQELPPVSKTPLMRRIEQYNGGKDIRLIISDIYSRHGSKAGIVEELGIDYSLLAEWTTRLGLSFEHSVAINGQRVPQEA